MWATTQIYEGLTPGDLILCATHLHHLVKEIYVCSVYNLFSLVFLTTL